MTKTDTRDVAATVACIRELAAAGCDIVRLAVPDEAAARALCATARAVNVPLVADIHFDHRLALLALEAGMDGLRINPGNIGAVSRVREVVRAAAERRVPIRIGVNAGSLDKDVLAKHGAATAAALVESALAACAHPGRPGLPRNQDFRQGVGCGAHRQAYRRLADQTDYPLHPGTEAGTLLPGRLQRGAGGCAGGRHRRHHPRVAFRAPAAEVRALALLRSLELRPPGPMVIACPTWAGSRLTPPPWPTRWKRVGKTGGGVSRAAWPVVAVMGCMVNGPGEARDADIAVAGGKGRAALYVAGRHIATVPENQILPALLEQVRGLPGPGRRTDFLYAPPALTPPSKISRSLRASSSRVTGLLRKCTPCSRMPRWAMTLAV